MSNDPETKPTAIDCTTLIKLFGPPPILSYEKLDLYNAKMAQYLACIGPEDFVVLMLARDLADCDWGILRLKRHKVLTIERKTAKRLEYQKSRTRHSTPKEPPEKPAEGQERLFELAWNVDVSADDVVEGLKRSEEGLNHAQGLEDGIDYFEHLDRLLTVDLTGFLNQRVRDYCIGNISSRWAANGANVCGAGGL